MFGAMSALWLFSTTDPILRGELGYDDIILVSLAGFLAVAAVYTYWASTNDEVLTFIRLVGWAGNTSAEVSGFSLNQLLIVLTAMVAGSALGLLTFAAPDIPVAMAIFSATGGLIVSVMFYRSKVTLEDTGICIGSKYRNRQFLPFERVSSIILKKNVLTVSLTKRPPLNFKTHRFLLLGNIETMRNELDRVAPSGIPTLICASSQQTPPGLTKPDIKFVGTDKSSLTMAGILLIVAGLFAFLTAAIFLIWDSNTSTPGGSPLFCCGILEIIFGAITILGGLLTVRRIKYRLAMTAAVVAIISVGGGFSLVLGVIALVMIHRSREDFVD